MRFKVFAKSGRAVEAAGPNDTLLPDKNGMITIGDRQANAVVSERKSVEDAAVFVGFDG